MPDFLNYIDVRLIETFNGTDTVSILFKLFLAIILSGIIGLERGKRKHTAGLRTHILVCVGACLVMMTNLFIIEYINPMADPARLGAQVITGVGFLGAGTIVFAGQQVLGLTTAAGLWASACLGLAIGIGFFSASILAALLIYIVLAFLPKLEDKIYARSKFILYHIEIEEAREFMNFMKYIKSQEIFVSNMSVSKNSPLVQGGISFRILTKCPDKMSPEQLEDLIQNFNGVYLIEKL